MVVPAFVFATFIAYWLIVRWWVVSIEERGQFGDAFGAFNALVSAFAFTCLVVAIFLQKKELKLQREELTATREVLGKQHEQFALQTDSMKKQAFENTFFQLLNLHNEIVNAASALGATEKGRGCLDYLYNDRLRGYHSSANNTFGGSDSDALKIIKAGYNDFNEVYQARIGHYFRNLYNIIKFVKNSEVSDKRLYTNVIRAQLSSSEMGLLFYSCLWYENRYMSSKFKKMIEEFSLFEGLPIDILFNRNDEMVLYAPSAYGKPE